MVIFNFSSKHDQRDMSTHNKPARDYFRIQKPSKFFLVKQNWCSFVLVGEEIKTLQGKKKKPIQ
jgi:hypothetical protein